MISQRGANLLFSQISQKLHENKENWAEREAPIRNLSMYIRHCICFSVCPDVCPGLFNYCILSIWDHSCCLRFAQKGMKSVISSCLLFFSNVTLKDEISDSELMVMEHVKSVQTSDCVNFSAPVI